MDVAEGNINKVSPANCPCHKVIYIIIINNQNHLLSVQKHEYNNLLGNDDVIYSFGGPASGTTVSPVVGLLSVGTVPSA